MSYPIQSGNVFFHYYKKESSHTPVTRHHCRSNFHQEKSDEHQNSQGPGLSEK
jgi:hypothetical protein